jgi:hypothetical protein
MKLKIVRFPTFPESPTNPARVCLDSGIIEINSQAFDALPPFVQQYVLAHEAGHYAHHTMNETIADAYALDSLAFTAPYSLYNSVNSVKKISHNNPERMKKIQYNALKKAADAGNTDAQSLLYKYAAADGTKSGLKIAPILAVVAVLAVVIFLFIKFKK